MDDLEAFLVRQERDLRREVTQRVFHDAHARMTLSNMRAWNTDGFYAARSPDELIEGGIAVDDFERTFRSGLTKMNSAISGHSGHAAGSKMVWREGVFDGTEEIRAADTPHAQRDIQSARSVGSLAGRPHACRTCYGI